MAFCYVCNSGVTSMNSWLRKTNEDTKSAQSSGLTCFRIVYASLADIARWLCDKYVCMTCIERVAKMSPSWFRAKLEATAGRFPKWVLSRRPPAPLRNQTKVGPRRRASQSSSARPRSCASTRAPIRHILRCKYSHRQGAFSRCARHDRRT